MTICTAHLFSCRRGSCWLLCRGLSRPGCRCERAGRRMWAAGALRLGSHLGQDGDHRALDDLHACSAFKGWQARGAASCVVLRAACRSCSELDTWQRNAYLVHVQCERSSHRLPLRLGNWLKRACKCRRAERWAVLALWRLIHACLRLHSRIRLQHLSGLQLSAPRAPLVWRCTMQRLPGQEQDAPAGPATQPAS